MDFNSTVKIYFKTSITVDTCSRTAVEELAAEMVRLFGIFPLTSVADSRYVIKEYFMSMDLKLNIVFEVSYGSIEVAEGILETIKDIIKSLPMVKVNFVSTVVE